jgi:GWxTD domain-containing protein
MSRRVACALLAFLSAGPPAPAQQVDSTHLADRFAEATESRLDSLYGPLLYVMEAGERGIYSTLSVRGKRDYLRRFWARRDPTPGTPENELEEEFYARIAQATRKFREGGAARIPGWRTDRGRIYVKYGPPDEVLSRPQPPGGLPYEVWKYTRKRLLKYCFVDLTGFGNFVLVWTNDRHEKSEPGWRQLLGWEAYEEVLRF